MRTLATKQPSKDSAQKQNGYSARRSHHSSSLSTGLPLLQRQCACGGGCPRCKESLIQTKLKISEPGDKYEQEADRIADRVMRIPEPSIERLIEPEEESVRRKAIPNPTPLNSAQSSYEVPPIIHEVLNSPGQLLDPETRTFMESRFGHDFSQVRVHTNTKAAESAKAVNALAYTFGRDLVFQQCHYNPTTAKGRKLLAHELAHVTQQASPIVQRTPIPGDPSSSPLVSPSLARFLGSLVLDNFALDRAILTRQHQVQLAELAETLLMLLRNYPSGIIRITGYADATGSESHNLGLGQRRADAVRDALILAGVPETRIITTSMGEEELRVSTQRAEPRNRRVEVQFQPESVVQLLSQPPIQAPPQPSQEPERPLDLRLRHPLEPETLEERINRILREPLPERPRRSFNDLFWERVDEGLDDVMDRVDVPESLRPWVRRGVRAAIERGAEEIFDRVADQVGLDDTQAETIRTVIEATIAQPVF
jgi:outer membrane protein OmpA-like peptidoglycan-associated protein